MLGRVRNNYKPAPNVQQVKPITNATRVAENVGSFLSGVRAAFRQDNVIVNVESRSLMSNEATKPIKCHK